MKKIAAVVVMVVMYTSGLFAWEFSQNPDRFPSVGVTLYGEGSDGEASYPSAPAIGNQDVEYSEGRFSVDTRLPVSNSLSLNFELGTIKNTAKAKETLFLDSQNVDTKGAFIAIGARYYFNK